MGHAGPLRLPPRLDIREVGLRDGLQLEQQVPLADKLRLLDAIVATGVRRVELSSFVSPAAVPQFADAAELAAYATRWPEVAWSALVPNLKGALRAIEAGITTVEYVISATDEHSLANTRQTTAAATAAIASIADAMHEVGGRVEVIVATAWDCPFSGRTPPELVLGIAEEAVAHGAEALCLGDTIGTVTPVRMLRLVDLVREIAGATPVGLHLHDTRGTGQANVLAAALAGVTQFDASVGGLGGCPFAPGASGNIATEELAYWTAEADVATGLDTAAVIEAAGLAQTILGHPLDSSLLRAGLPRQHAPTGADSTTA